MKWSKENYYHNLSSPYCLRLASGDASGKIIVWDVVSGTAHCEIQEHSKPIQGKGSFKTPLWLSLQNWIDWLSMNAVQKIYIYMYAEVLLAICFHQDTLAIRLCPSHGAPPPLCPAYSNILPLSLPDLEWLWNQDASRDLLLAVHPPNYIVLWNGDTGTKLWKKSYAENILSFSFDPFDSSNMACRCSTDDLSPLSPFEVQF